MSTTSKVAGLLAAGATVLTGTLLAAPPAAATTYVVSACDAALIEPGTYAVLYRLEPGDSLVVEALGIESLSAEPGCYIGYWGPQEGAGDMSIQQLADPPRIVFTSSGNLGYGATLAGLWDGSDWDGSEYFAFAASCDDTTIEELAPLGVPVLGSCTDANSLPADLPPVLQQTTPLSDGSCVITDPSYNWAGVESGGWSQSWAQWVDGGIGGAVCTRTLSYASTGGWVVAG